MILRDIDVLEALAERGLVNVYVSMQAPIEGIRSKIELGTSTVAERFRTMRRRDGDDRDCGDAEDEAEAADEQQPEIARMPEATRFDVPIHAEA